MCVQFRCPSPCNYLAASLHYCMAVNTPHKFPKSLGLDGETLAQARCPASLAKLTAPAWASRAIRSVDVRTGGLLSQQVEHSPWVKVELVKEEVIRVDNFDVERAEDIGGEVTDIKGYDSVGPTMHSGGYYMAVVRIR